MGLKLQKTTRENKDSSPGKHTAATTFCHTFTCLNWEWNHTYLTGKLSTHNQSQWGFDGRNMQLCSPRVRAAVAQAVNAAPSQAGTPTYAEKKHHHQHWAFSTWKGDSEMCKMYHTLTKRYCARATFCGNFRYNPPVMSQAYKNNTAWFVHIRTVQSICICYTNDTHLLRRFTLYSIQKR